MKITVEFDSLEEFQKYIQLQSPVVPQVAAPPIKDPSFLPPDPLNGFKTGLIIDEKPKTVYSKPFTPSDVVAKAPATTQLNKTRCLKNFNVLEFECILGYLHQKYGDDALTSQAIYDAVRRGGFLQKELETRSTIRGFALLWGKLVQTYNQRHLDGNATKYKVAVNSQAKTSPGGWASSERIYSISYNNDQKVKVNSFMTPPEVGSKFKDPMLQGWKSTLDRMLGDSKCRTITFDAIAGGQGTSEQRFTFLKHMASLPNLQRHHDDGSIFVKLEEVSV